MRQPRSSAVYHRGLAAGVFDTQTLLCFLWGYSGRLAVGKCRCGGVVHEKKKNMSVQACVSSAIYVLVLPGEGSQSLFVRFIGSSVVEVF